MDTMKLIPYIDDEHLKSYAANCAKAMRPDESSSGRGEAAGLRRSYAEIERCHSVLLRRCSGASHIDAVCEWLLDNRYMIQREYPAVLSAFRQSSELRSSHGRLIITELCRSLLQAGHGQVTADRCSLFLDGFQSVTVLQRRELSLFPAALRCAIIEGIAEICAKLSSSAESSGMTDDIAALFTSLRLLSAADMDEILDRADVSGAVLAQDPTGHFPKMDRITKKTYLERLERMARRRGMEEQLLARELLGRAAKENRHIGFYLFSPPSPVRSALYIGVNILLTLFISLCLAFCYKNAVCFFLLLIPIWALVKGFIDYITLHITSPRPLPRMDMSRGIPEEGKTVCVISVLLGCCRPERLEELRLASMSEGKNLLFGLLADLPGAPAAHMPEDGKLLREAEDAVRRLNEKYGGGFYLFTRERRFDGVSFSGHERKRGALLELAKLLCGEESELHVFGDPAALAGAGHIISLDADTRIYPGSLGELTGAALHPLCRPVIDERRGVVCSGHAEMQTESRGHDRSCLRSRPAGGA